MTCAMFEWEYDASKNHDTFKLDLDENKTSFGFFDRIHSNDGCLRIHYAIGYKIVIGSSLTI